MKNKGIENNNFRGIILAEGLLRRLCASRTCSVDGLAKMPLPASIFASWYNII